RADHAGCTDLVFGHLVGLDLESQPFEQFLGALAMGVAIAGGVVRRHLDQLGQERFLLRAVLVDILRQRGFNGIHVVSCGHLRYLWSFRGDADGGAYWGRWKCSTKSANTRAAVW